MMDSNTGSWCHDASAVSSRPLGSGACPRTPSCRRAAARRIALAAQGFAEPRPTGRIDARQLRKVIDRVAMLQLDSVNVFSRSHYLPVFSRLGPYPREVLDSLTGAHRRPGPAGDVRVLGPRGVAAAGRARSRCCAGGWNAPTTRRGAACIRIARDNPAAGRAGARADPSQRPDPLRRYRHPASGARAGPDVELARRQDRARVPVLGRRDHAPRGGSTSSGATTCPSGCCRPRSSTRPRPTREDAQRELVRVAARALGVATEPDLGDYFRLPRAESKLRVAELVEAGELLPVEVDGWGAPAYLWPEARRPRPGRTPGRCSPVRLADLVPGPDRAAVRLPLPDRDLHAGAASGCTATTCCRSCSATGWWPGSI